MIGQTLSHYRVIAKLGRGGMGVVYEASDIKLGRHVALKFLPAELSRDADAMERFQREARTASALNHPNICTIYEIDEHEGQQFLVMELLEGQTLFDRLESGPVPIDQALEWGIQIADALEAAHAQGIIHRDIKPGNIFITKRGQAKILDFGLAKIAPRRGQAGGDAEGLALTVDERARDSATQPGLILGTTSYMSPEQARGVAVDARTDIWSLGVTLYEMVAGRRPFAGPTGSDIMSLILLQEPPPLTLSPQEAQEPIGKVLSRALRKNPENRYQTAKELGTDLIELKEVLRRSVEGARPVSWPPGSSPTPLPRESAAERPSTVSGASSAAAPAQGPVSARAEEIAGGQGLGKKAGLLVLVAALIAAGVLGTYLYYGRTGDSLAVMPFTYENTEASAMKDPDREYLSDGITESVINGVSQVPNLKVIASSSVFRYKGKEMDPPAIARQLGVRKILTGRIVQRGDDLRISVELLDALENAHVWGEQYNRKLAGLDDLSTEIANEISRNLRMRWRSAPNGPKPATETAEAYQAYLKGRYYWNKRTGEDVHKSIEYYQQAIAKSPGYALAYAGLADSYGILWVYSNVPRKEAVLRSNEAAHKALEIDNNLAEAHAVLAANKTVDAWDFAGSESEFRKAIALNPNYATAHQWFAENFTFLGKFDEALSEINKAQELDPLSLIINAAVGETLMRAGRYDQAIAQLHRTIELDKSFPWAHIVLRDAYEKKELFEEAIAEDETATTLLGATSEQAAQRAASLREAYAKSGAAGYWQKRLDIAEAHARQGQALSYEEEDASPYQLACLYARLGKKDLAVQSLEKAYEERDLSVYYVASAAQFNALRGDPRVADLLRRLGLPR